MRVGAADHLAAHLDGAPVDKRDGLDAPADPVARLQDDHVGSAARQVSRRRQAGQTGSQHSHIGHGSSPSTKPKRSGA